MILCIQIRLPQNLTVPFCSSLSQTFASFSSSWHLSLSLSLWFFGFSLGFNWLFLFLMGRWGRTWRIRWSWFVADLMVLGLMISEFGFSLSFGEFRRLGCVDGAGQLWWIWVWWLDWVHCSSFFLLVFTLIFSSCFHLCSTDLGLSSWVAGFVFLWWVWVLGC